MTFHIGSQNAGVVNNVSGDQRIDGGQHGTLVATADAVRAVGELRSALDQVVLDPQTATAAREHVAEIEAALTRPEPDRAQVAGRLERFTRLVTAAGAITAAGTALHGPVRALAGWLGALGVPTLSLLP